MGESHSPELAELASLVRERNAIEVRIGQLVDRPVHTGGMGEWIAARIFDIELEPAANAAGYDGWFTSEPLRGKSVNVKTYTRDERDSEVGGDLLDRHPVLTVAGDPDNIVTELSGVRPGHNNILPASPPGQAISDFTCSCSRPGRGGDLPPLQ